MWWQLGNAFSARQPVSWAFHLKIAFPPSGNVTGNEGKWSSDACKCLIHLIVRNLFCVFSGQPPRVWCHLEVKAAQACNKKILPLFNGFNNWQPWIAFLSTLKDWCPGWGYYCCVDVKLWTYSEASCWWKTMLPLFDVIIIPHFYTLLQKKKNKTRQHNRYNCLCSFNHLYFLKVNLFEAAIYRKCG